MYIAEKLRKQNVIAYLVYMYQVEDVIRAYGFDVDRIREDYLVRFGYDEGQQKKASEWYAALVDMMKEEGCQERGHVQVVRATLVLLEDRHQELLATHEHADYEAMYSQVLPVLVELRSKGGKERTEVENCMDAIYGLSVLEMRHQEVSAETRRGLKPVAQLMEMLGKYYRESQN
ncbi:MAG: DUF4924 family protein [Bacteroidaceae bacterium]